MFSPESNMNIPRTKIIVSVGLVLLLCTFCSAFASSTSYYYSKQLPPYSSCTTKLKSHEPTIERSCQDQFDRYGQSVFRVPLSKNVFLQIRVKITFNSQLKSSFCTTLTMAKTSPTPWWKSGIRSSLPSTSFRDHNSPSHPPTPDD